MMLAKQQGRLIVGALMLMGLTLGTTSGCGGGGGTAKPSASAVAKTVGAIDQEVLFALPEFKKAEEELEKEAKKIQSDAEAKLPKDGKLTDAHRKIISDTQTQLTKLANSKLDPLKTKMEASILKVSRDKKLAVVLDKRIVVYGVSDITEDVKKTFQTQGEIKTGDEVDTSKSPIGYFDQDVVRSLKIFQQIEVDLYRKREDLKKEFMEKQEKLSPSEKAMLQQELKIKFDTYRESVMTPLYQKVNDSVKEVAQAQGLSLVLDKQHVMQGGRNMTSEVVETFLNKASGGDKASATPAASSTPAKEQ